MAIASEAGEGDTPFSITKPRVPAGLDDEKSAIKYSASSASVMEALIEAGLDESLILPGIMYFVYVLQCTLHRGLR